MAHAHKHPKLLAAVATMLLAGTSPASAQAGPASSLLLIKSAADVLGAVGDAVGKLTDGIQKMVIAGDRGLNTVAARRTHASLIELSRMTTGLAVSQRVAAIPALEAYLESPGPAAWAVTTATLRDVLITADSVLSRLNVEKSDLVLQPAYAELQNAIQARVSILTRLTQVPPPTSKGEMAELRNVLTRYRMLVVQLEAARDELNAYARETGG